MEGRYLEGEVKRGVVLGEVKGGRYWGEVLKMAPLPTVLFSIIFSISSYSS